MFRSTLPLQKKTELRLRGIRGPSIRILREEIRKVRNAARRISFGGPDEQYGRGTPRSLRPSIQTTYDALLARKTADNSKPWLISPSQLMAQASWRWAHSIYSFNKNAIKPLIATTNSSKAAVRSYLNMIPSQDLDILTAAGRLGPPATAVISDRLRAKSPIPQSFMGKVSKLPNGFWRPCRELLIWEPAILFKHRLGGRVDAMMFVHDQRIDFLKQELAKIGRQITALI